jgi:hypothetical protein
MHFEQHPERRPSQALAAAINREVELAEATFSSTVQHAVRAGELLLEAKRALPHGGWRPWVEENFCRSLRTAQAYMRIAAHRNAQGLAHLGIEGALKQIAKRSESRRDRPKPGIDHLRKALRPLWKVDVEALPNELRELDDNEVYEAASELNEVAIRAVQAAMEAQVEAERRAAADTEGREATTILGEKLEPPKTKWESWRSWEPGWARPRLFEPADRARVWMPGRQIEPGGPASKINSSPCPNDPVESSLSDVLVAAADPRFSLSPRAARGILQRAAKHGKQLPQSLERDLGRIAEREAVS